MSDEMSTGTPLFDVDRAELVRHLRALVPVAWARNGGPKGATIGLALEGDLLVLTGSRMDQWAVRTLRATETMGDPIRVRVGLRELLRVLGVARGERVRFWRTGTKGIGAFSDDRRLNVWSGTLKVSMPYVPLEGGDPGPPKVYGPSRVVPGADLEAIRRVLPMASTDESRPILTGVSFDRDENLAVTTDSYRLSIVELESPALGGALVPGSFLQSALVDAEAGDWTVRVDDRHVQIETADGQLWVSRLIEGGFPNWRPLVTPGENSVTFNRAGLISTIRRVHVAAGWRKAWRTPGVTLRRVIDGPPPRGHLRVGMKVDDTEAHEVLPIIHGGQDLDIAFAPDYLADALKALEGDEVTLMYQDSLKPALFHEGGFRTLVMPVRVR